MVYKVLGKLKALGQLAEAEIVIESRGAPGNRLAISGEKVTELKKTYFMYINDRGEETFIPLHRVREVRKEGLAIWKREK